MLVTRIDKHRLMDEADRALLSRPGDRPNVEELKGLLDVADVVAPEGIDPDVVTMNSRVRLEDLESHEKSILTVVYPGDTAPDAGKVSVLSPIGMAVLGRRAGDVIQRRVPAGVRRLKLLKVLYQPEAAGERAS